MNKLLVLLGVVCVAHMAAAYIQDHTGDAFGDYSGSAARFTKDPHNSITNDFNTSPWSGESQDVGTPSQISTRSGWDVRGVYMNYDRPTDSMQMGIDCYGICGDADGDGRQGEAGAALTANSGFDKESLQSSEMIALMLELDPADQNRFNFNPTVAIGWPSDPNAEFTEFNIYDFNPGFKFTPSAGFTVDGVLSGAESFTITYIAPIFDCTEYAGRADGCFENVNTEITDVEFTIQPWTNLPGLQSLDPVFDDISFKWNLFAGSFEDDGVGEDNIPNAGEGEPELWEGCTPDECLICPGEFGYGFGEDTCGNCPSDPGYQTSEDECGICYGNGADVCDLCPGEFGYGFGPDACGLCPDDFNYMDAWDECGECFGPGEDPCGLCNTHPDYMDAWDECGICFGPGEDDCGICSDEPGYMSSWDECGICFGPGRDDCGVCSDEAGYMNSWDECGICFGPGRDFCDLCPDDDGYLQNWCIGCDGNKNSGCEYNSCGLCCVPDDECECWFDEYKGYKKWDLDRIITYWNIVHTLWDAIMIKDDLAAVIDAVYEHDSAFDVTEGWYYWCHWVMEWHMDCLEPFAADWNMFLGELNSAVWFNQ